MWEETRHGADNNQISADNTEETQYILALLYCILFELVLSDISWPTDLVVVVLFLATEGRGQREGLSHVTRDSGTISM